MPGVARIGDSGTAQCTCHDGTKTVSFTITSGSPSTEADGIPIARIGDSIIGSCGHGGKITSGSPSTEADGIPVARIGDSVGAGCIVSGTITSGSPTMEVD